MPSLRISKNQLVFVSEWNSRGLSVSYNHPESRLLLIEFKEFFLYHFLFLWGKISIVIIANEPSDATSTHVGCDHMIFIF